MTNVATPKPERQAGELRPLADGFAARIRIGKGRREEYVLETCGHDATKARARCTALAEIAIRMRKADVIVDDIDRVIRMGSIARDARAWDAIVTAVDLLCNGQTLSDGTPESTFMQFATEWTTGKLHAKWPDHVATKDHRTDIIWLNKYVEPILRDLPIDLVSLEHCEQIMTSLPAELAPATRRQVAQVLRRVLSLAVYPARLRKENPLPKGWLPRLTATKAKECLYPDEDVKLLAHIHTPIARRLAYGFLTREGMRTGELASLKWSDVDLDRGRIKLDENKTDDPRAWALDAGVHLALSAWFVQLGEPDASTHVFIENGVPLNVERLAKQLRFDLEKAGVRRPELLKGSKTRLALRAHDLRATFVTVALANGKSETFVADRTGHRSSQMIARYRRQARTWEQMGLGVLASLHQAIPELAEAFAGQQSLPHELPHKTPRTGGGIGRRSGFRLGSAESEVTASRENKPIDDPKLASLPPHGADVGQKLGRSELLATMREKLDAAILAERWDAVAAINLRLRDLEREGVVGIRSRKRGRK